MICLTCHFLKGSFSLYCKRNGKTGAPPAWKYRATPPIVPCNMITTSLLKFILYFILKVLYNNKMLCKNTGELATIHFFKSVSQRYDYIPGRFKHCCQLFFLLFALNSFKSLNSFFFQQQWNEKSEELIDRLKLRKTTFLPTSMDKGTYTAPVHGKTARLEG